MATTRWLNDDEQQAWRLLLRVTLTLVGRLDEELRSQHQLSLGDYEILAHLSSSPDRRLRMRDLSARALVSRSRLTHTVDRLVARGYVSREPCQQDRRGVSAVLTGRGLERLSEAAPTHVAGVRRLLIDPLGNSGVNHVAGALTPVLQHLAATPGSEGCALDSYSS